MCNARGLQQNELSNLPRCFLKCTEPINLRNPTDSLPGGGSAKVSAKVPGISYVNSWSVVWAPRRRGNRAMS